MKIRRVAWLFFVFMAAVGLFSSFGHRAEAREKLRVKIDTGEYTDLLQKDTEFRYISFYSAKPEIAYVDGDGRIFGYKKGKTRIIANDTKGGHTTVIVTVRKNGFMLPKLQMLTTEKLKLQYQFSKIEKNVKWKSSDKRVAAVTGKGVLKAKRKGEARITGTDGKHRYFCRLTVKKKPKSIIYLTFDDGPNRYSTPKVLDILKMNKVKATFFELKPAKADYDLTRRVIKEGHTLAIHGYSHHYNEIYQNEKTYKNNLDKLQKLFFNTFGQWCTLTRFPGGSSNTISRHYNRGIMSRLSKKVHEWGYLYYDWNVSSSDAGGAKNAKQVYHSVISGLQKGRSNIVLMHDFAHNDKTIHALEKIIRYGKKHGYAFRRLTPASIEIHHGVNN